MSRRSRSRPPEAPVPEALPSGAPPPSAREAAVRAVFATPLGPLHAAAVDAGIVALELRTTDDAFVASVERRTGQPTVPASGPGASAPARAHLAALEGAIRRYLAGDGTALDLPVILEGLSDWDRRVLAGVRTIPFGATASYGEVARRIGSPGAARAVGGAVGRNPVALIVPCHRVVAGDGTLGGYGGSWYGSRDELLALKERLLASEGVAPPPRSAPRPR